MRQETKQRTKYEVKRKFWLEVKGCKVDKIYFNRRDTVSFDFLSISSVATLVWVYNETQNLEGYYYRFTRDKLDNTDYFFNEIKK